MPARPSYLPNHRERVALQLLRGHGDLPLKTLHPAGLTTVAKMVSKAWVERVGSGTYRITATGLEALKAPIPKGRDGR